MRELPPFPDNLLPASPEERLRLTQYGEECYRQALEDASWACGAVAFDGCHEWRRETVNMCLAAISALLAARSGTSKARTPEHVCGLQGYNGMIDPPCPGCEARNAAWDAARSGGKGDGE